MNSKGGTTCARNDYHKFFWRYFPSILTRAGRDDCTRTLHKEQINEFFGDPL